MYSPVAASDSFLHQPSADGVHTTFWHQAETEWVHHSAPRESQGEFLLPPFCRYPPLQLPRMYLATGNVPTEVRDLKSWRPNEEQVEYHKRKKRVMMEIPFCSTGPLV